MISDSEETEKAKIEAVSGVMAAGVVVFVLGAAGNAVVGASGAIIYETYLFWSVMGYVSLMSQRDPHAYQLWVLKNGAENTHIMLSEYQEKIVNDCIDVLYKYYPEEIEKIDILELRKLISLNIPM
jgi:hypothetical protein